LAPQIPVGEPSALRAGVTWSWKRAEASDFPVADLWVYTYYLTGKTSLSFVATNSIPNHDVTVSVAAATTAVVAAGVYQWELRASLSGAIYTVDSGTFDVLATSAVTAASDQRSHAEKMLAMVEAEIQARVTGDGSAHSSYIIGTRQLDKIPLEGPDSLHALRVVYQMEIQRERNGGKLPAYRAVMCRP
jgi:hypothetical protein